MIVNAVFIVGSCGNTECVSAVGLIPEVDPIPERHIRFNFIGRASVLFFQRFELSGTFCFFVFAVTHFVIGRLFSLYPTTILPSHRPSLRRRNVPSPFFLFLAIGIISFKHNLIHKAPHDSGSVSLHIGGHMGVGAQRKAGVGMPEDSRQGFRIHAARQRVSGEGVPLRYNNDKQKKPLFSRGLSVCRLLFNSFSKLKIDENYKEKRRLFY